MFYFYSKVFLPTLWQFTDAQMKIKNTVKLCHLASKISNVFYTRWSICKMVSILSQVLYMVLGFCYMFHVKILWAVLRDIRAGSLSYFTIKKINKLRMPDKSVELMPQLSFTMFLSCVFFCFFLEGLSFCADQRAVVIGSDNIIFCSGLPHAYLC